MSELEKALAAVGEIAPERPVLSTTAAMEAAGVIELATYTLSLESLALRLAVRLERAERCRYCEGRQLVRDRNDKAVDCPACSGTGKEKRR